MLLLHETYHSAGMQGSMIRTGILNATFHEPASRRTQPQCLALAPVGLG